jgi:Family of unknown function (DUF5908)
MPLEIKELQISITVNQQPGAGTSPAAPPPSAGGAKENLQECIDAVMTIINNKRER